MKIVELKIDDSQLAGIDAVALVESPATELDFLAFKKHKSTQECNCGSYEEFAGKPGLVHPNCKCSIQKGKFRTDGSPCPICREAAADWKSKGRFSTVFGIEYDAKVFGPNTSIGFNKVSMAEMSYNDYPQAAVDAAKRGIEINAEIGNKCATQVGKVRAQQLANREPVSIDTIQRMRSFLIRQKGNYELAIRRKDYTACGYVSYLLWGGEAALPWAEKKLRQAGIEFSQFERYKPWNEYAEIGPRGGVTESPKAPKSDTPNPDPKGEGTARGDASTTRGAEVDAATEKILQEKADNFNEKYKDKLGYGVNVGMLKSVYQRGLGAYNTSRSPEVASRGGAKQWALARVNAFLYLVKEGRPQNRKYITDYDLLPTEHPKKEKFQEYIAEEIIKDALNINVFGYPTEYFYMCPGAISTFEHLISMEVDEDTKGMIRSAAQIADNIFDLEEDVIEDGIAAPEDVELASILISDFKDLIKEIDVITGMIHSVDYMDAHLETIKSYLPQETFELDVTGLPNYSNETSGSLVVKDVFAALKDKQMLIGPLMTPGKLIPRLDEETGEEYQVFFTKETIQKIAYKMMQDKLVDSVNIEHDNEQRVDDVYLVETWIVLDPERDKSLVYGFQPIEGQWYGIYKINNKTVWEEYVKTGKVKGFSVEGYFYNNILKNK